MASRRPGPFSPRTPARPAHAGDRCRHSGGGQGLSRPPIHNDCRRRLGDLSSPSPICSGSPEAIGFAIGERSLSGAAGYIGMNRLGARQCADRRRPRVAESLADGLSIAFRAGAITGLASSPASPFSASPSTSSSSLRSLGLAPASREVVDALVALGFGASLISIFARLGGGIFTKGADVGGDLVGKVEAGIPEDDPRNPATIADNVGDNVGDCAGMAADLFETYVVTVVATMVLASIYFAGGDRVMEMMLYPLAIGAACVLTSIAGTYFVRLGKSQSIMGALYKGVLATGVLSLILLWPVTALMVGMSTAMKIGDVSFTGRSLYFCGVVGLGGHRADRGHHRILHRHELPPGAVDRQGLRDGPRHQRHSGPRRLDGVDRAARARHHGGYRHCLRSCRPVRYRHSGDNHARARRHDRRARCLLVPSPTTPEALPKWQVYRRTSARPPTRSMPWATTPRRP